MVGDRIRFLESDTGDIGVMQVNKHVWRGFYEYRPPQVGRALQRGRGGCEILAQMSSSRRMSQAKYDPVLISRPSGAIDLCATTAARARAIDGVGASRRAEASR